MDFLFQRRLLEYTIQLNDAHGLENTATGFNFLKLFHRHHSAKHHSFTLTQFQLKQPLEEGKKGEERKWYFYIYVFQRKARPDVVQDWLSQHLPCDFALPFYDFSRFHASMTFTIHSFPLSPELHPPTPSKC